MCDKSFSITRNKLYFKVTVLKLFSMCIFRDVRRKNYWNHWNGDQQILLFGAFFHIMEIRPCSIQRIFSAVKIENFIRRFFDIVLYKRWVKGGIHYTVMFS